MKKRNILAENMRRFGTKNLAEQNSELDPSISDSGESMEQFRDFLDNASNEEIYAALEDTAGMSPSEIANMIWQTLEWASEKFNTPEAVIQAAVQQVKNRQIWNQLLSYMPEVPREKDLLTNTWHDGNKFYDFLTPIIPNTEWTTQFHRGATIDDIYAEFQGETEVYPW